MNTMTETATQISRKITKVKINKDGGVGVGYTLSIPILDDKENEITLGREIPIENGLYLPHKDLTDALDLLRAHLAIICDLKEAKGMDLGELDDDKEALAKLKISGFSIGGNDEHEGVTLIGQKTLPSKLVLNIIAPFTKYQDENNGYEYGVELQATISHCCNEAEMYLDGKIAPSAQQSLEFPKQGDDVGNEEKF
jgi:hypothetical protein